MKTNLYQRAVVEIRNKVETTLTELEAAERKARDEYGEEVRRAIVAGVPVESPEYSIASLLHNTIRFSAFPDYVGEIIPDETWDVMMSAEQAGALRMSPRYNYIRVGEADFSKENRQANIREGVFSTRYTRANHALNALNDYKNRQTVDKL